MFNVIPSNAWLAACPCVLKPDSKTIIGKLEPSVGFAQWWPLIYKWWAFVANVRLRLTGALKIGSSRMCEHRTTRSLTTAKGDGGTSRVSRLRRSFYVYVADKAESSARFTFTLEPITTRAPRDLSHRNNLISFWECHIRPSSWISVRMEWCLYGLNGKPSFKFNTGETFVLAWQFR